MQTLSGLSFGRYQLLEPLGEGGMATVYRGFDTRLERPVAIKVIRTDYNREPEFLKRFEREARALAQLNHPHIVKVLDVGEHDGVPFVVMEFLGGGTLRNRIGQPLAPAEAARLILPIARALEYAHQLGVIHRDVKPANILLTDRGEPSLSDFGIAKILERRETTELTATGMGVGTPDYMAPEQWQGRASPQSDLYALGVVLYELLTGRRPYVADTPVAVLLKHASDPLPPPRQFVPGLPVAVEQVLVKALAKKPEDRYASMGAFADALEQAARAPASTPRPGWWPWAAGAGVVALVGVALALGASVLIWRLAGSRPTTEPASPGAIPAAAASPSTRAPVPTDAPALTPTPVPTATAETPATATPVPTVAVSDGGGGLIAFYSNQGGSNDIYVMNADGSNIQQLTHDDSDSRLPAWSRDGRRIAYQSNVNGMVQILVLTLATGRIEQVTTEGCNHYNPVWSGHDRIAYYADCDGNREIYTMAADGSGVLQLTTTQDAYNWFPFWSPDDTLITFSSNREGSRYQIYVMGSDGSNPVPLARGCISAFSPNGAWIVFSSYCDGTGDILTMDSQGGHIANLTNGVGENANPSWSRDGTRIVFQSKRDGAVNLYAMDPDGSNLIQLTTGEAVKAAPVWQP